MHAKPAIQLNVRLDPDVYETVIRLSERYGTKARVVTEAVALLDRAVTAGREDSDPAPAAPDGPPTGKRTRARGGQSMFGYRWVNGQLVEDPAQHAGLMRLVTLKESTPKLSNRKVADQLNNEGILSATGGTWSGSTVDKTFKRYRAGIEDGKLPR